jgi:lysophospholipase L1-like esterase
MLLSRIAGCARCARNVLLVLALIFIAGLFVFKPPPLPQLDLPAPGIQVIPVQCGPFGFMFRHQLEGCLESDKLSDYGIFLQSKLGHSRVDLVAPFTLPVYYQDEVAIQISGTASGVIHLRDARISRQVLPGLWLVLFCLALGIVYFHGLGGRKLSKERCVRYILAGVSTIFSLAFFSVLLQMVDPLAEHKKEDWQLFPPRLYRKIYIYPGVCPGIPEGVAEFKINSEGIQARERWPGFESAFSVLCVGASTTECMLLGQAGQWPSLLERQLQKIKGTNVWVGNAGHSGYTTAAVLNVASNYVPRIKPKYLVVLTGFNEALVPEERHSEFADDAVSCGFSAKLETLSQKIVVLRLLKRALFSHAVRSPHDVYFGENNLEINRLRRNYQTAARLTPPRDRKWNDADSSEFEQRLRAFDALAKQNGARLILCTVPTIYRADLTPAETQLLCLCGNYTAGSNRRKMDLINNCIRKVAKDLGVPLVDLDQILPRSTEVVFDDCHFNVRGAQLVADAVYKCLAEQ